MCVRVVVLCAAALTVLLCACEHEEVGYWPDSEITVGKEIATETPDGLSDDVGPSDVEASEAPITGPPCEADEKCETGFCLSDAFLALMGLGDDISIPGGLCSILGCSDDAECGDSAVCIDGEPFGAPGFQLCLPECSAMVDCRWEEAWGCVAPLDDQPELSVCLPDNIIVALECEDPENACEEVSP